MVNFNDLIPAAPSGEVNIKWQRDAAGNVSASYVPGDEAVAQTPWTQDIDAAGFKLYDAGEVSAQGFAARDYFSENLAPGATYWENGPVVTINGDNAGDGEIRFYFGETRPAGTAFAWTFAPLRFSRAQVQLGQNTIDEVFLSAKKDIQADNHLSFPHNKSFGWNIKSSDGTDYRYAVNGPAWQMYALADGTFQLKDAPSGTAGGVATFTNRFFMAPAMALMVADYLHLTTKTAGNSNYIAMSDISDLQIRWTFGQTGGAAGDFFISRWAGGVFVDSPMTINRATGLATFKGLTAQGNVIIGGTLNVTGNVTAPNIVNSVFGRSGTVVATLGDYPPNKLGSGTPDNTKFLRGDGSWAVPAGGGGSGSQTPWTSDIDAAGFGVNNLGTSSLNRDSDLVFNAKWDGSNYRYISNGASMAMHSDANYSTIFVAAPGTAGAVPSYATAVIMQPTQLTFQIPIDGILTPASKGLIQSPWIQNIAASHYSLVGSGQIDAACWDHVDATNPVWHTAGLVISEVQGVTTSQTDLRFSPRLTFSWTSRGAVQLGWDNGSGLRTFNSAGTGYAPFFASAITAYGANISTHAVYAGLVVREANLGGVSDPTINAAPRIGFLWSSWNSASIGYFPTEGIRTFSNTGGYSPFVASNLTANGNIEIATGVPETVGKLTWNLRYTDAWRYVANGYGQIISSGSDALHFYVADTGTAGAVAVGKEHFSIGWGYVAINSQYMFVDEPIANTARFWTYRELGGLTRWQVGMQSADYNRDWVFVRYDSSGAWQGTPLKISGLTGDVSVSNNLLIPNGRTVSLDYGAAMALNAMYTDQWRYTSAGPAGAINSNASGVNIYMAPSGAAGAPASLTAAAIFTSASVTLNVPLTATLDSASRAAIQSPWVNSPDANQKWIANLQGIFFQNDNPFISWRNLAGTTMYGLEVSSTSWAITRFVGGTFVDAPLRVYNADGRVLINYLRTPSIESQFGSIFTMQYLTTKPWTLDAGFLTYISNQDDKKMWHYGMTSGSARDFEIARYDSTGTLVDKPLTINRATGQTSISNINKASLGSGTADATTFLRGDGTWAVPAGGGGSQTPWTSDIDAAGFKLSNLGNTKSQGHISLGITNVAAFNMEFTDMWRYRSDGPAFGIAAQATTTRFYASPVGTAGTAATLVAIADLTNVSVNVGVPFTTPDVTTDTQRIKHWFMTNVDAAGNRQKAAASSYFYQDTDNLLIAAAPNGAIGSPVTWSYVMQIASTHLWFNTHWFQPIGSNSGWNLYHDGTDYRYKSANTAVQFQTASGSEAISWNTAASGAANAVVTFTERFYVSPTASRIRTDALNFRSTAANDGSMNLGFFTNGTNLQRWAIRMTANTANNLNIYRFNDSGVEQTNPIIIDRSNMQVTLPFLIVSNRINFNNSGGSKIVYATGYEVAYESGGSPNCISHLVPAAGIHRWYCASAIDNGATDKMELTNTLFTLSNVSLVIATSNAPSSATSTGVTGQITWDTGFIYVCTATNTWKRVAIATW